MTDTATQIGQLEALLRDFAVDRDWPQFHDPKNLAMAVGSEAGELLAEFRWLTPDESTAVMADPEKGQAVTDEIADVAIFLLRLTEVLGVDLDYAIRDKLARNAHRFPRRDDSSMGTSS